MRPKFNKHGIVLYQGDCREVMSQLAECSVETIITDPPYGLEFMGQEWDTLRAQSGARFGKPGIGERERPWPRFEPTPPSEAANSRYTHHGGDRSTAGSSAPHWAVQEWHRRWAIEALRVAKPGAFLLAFGGTRTFHRLACALEEAGWIISDCIMWLYGSGFPKSWDISKAIDRAAGIKRKRIGISSGPNHSLYTGERYRERRSTRFGTVQDQPDLTAPSTSAAKRWNGWGTGLKPAWEPIIVAMKPLHGTFARNALKHGVAGLWIDGVRIPANDTRSGGFGNGKRPWQSGPVGGNTQYVGSEQGRWPANIILDEGTSAMLDEQSGERLAGGAPQRRVSPKTDNAYGEYGMACPPGIGRSIGGASRFFYCAKASRNERNQGLSGMPKKMLRSSSGPKSPGTFQSEGTDKYARNHHPTVKPLKLMEYLCKLTRTPTGGIILDPFAGSGSTLIAARNVGRKCIGIECDRDYVRIAQARLKASTGAQEVKGVPSRQAA